MAAKLSNEQRQLIQKNPGAPLPVEDDQSQKVYILIERDEYQQLNSIGETGLHHAQLQKLIQDGIDSGPSIPADEVFADLREQIAQLKNQA